MADDAIREEPERDSKRGMKNSLRLKKDSWLLYGRKQNPPNLRDRFGGVIQSMK